MTDVTLSISVAVLWALVLILAFVVLALARQIGVLHERIAPVGALMTAKGLAVGDRVPSVVTQDLNGKSWDFSHERSDGKATLLLFVSPTCPVCKSLLPIIKDVSRVESDRFEIVLASDGDLTEHQQYRERESLNALPYILSAPLGMSFQIGRLPYSVLIDAKGILKARGLINSREHLESLFEAYRLNVASIQDYLQNQHS